jgi:RNA polymerase-binding transcription factor DksA
MTPKEQERYRSRLTALRARLSGDVTQLAREGLRQTGGEASGNLSNTPFHLADLASDNYEEEMTLGLLESQEQNLEQVRAALARLDGGTFGQCTECGRPIDPERLQALPHTPHCIDCARQLQGRLGGGPDTA